MDNMNRLFELTFSHGGPGEVKAELDESPSTQAYYQAAAQNLPDYAQALADIHRQGDLDREAFNLIMPFYNNGLNNLYQEKLKEKEFQNDLAKTQLTYDLADRNEANRQRLEDQLKWNVRRYNRANALADRQHNEGREDYKYNRELQRIEKERDLATKLAFPQKPNALMEPDNANTNVISGIDMSNGKTDVKYTILEPKMNLTHPKNIELSQKFQQESGPVPLSNKQLANLIYDYIRNHTTYEGQVDAIDQLKDLQFAYDNRNNNYRDPNAANFTPSNEYSDETTSLAYKNTGMNREGGFFNGVMAPFNDMADKQSLNYAMKNGLVLLDEKANIENKAYRALVKYFNDLDTQTMSALGFGNTNGLEGKRIYYDRRTGDFLVSEINNPDDILQRFRIVSDGFRDKVEYKGNVDYTQFGRGTNNYRPITFRQNAKNIYDDWSFNTGEKVGSVLRHPINSAEKAANYIGNMTETGIAMAQQFPDKPAFKIRGTNTVVTYKDVFGEGTNLENWKKILYNAHDYIMSDEFRQLVQNSMNLVKDTYNKGVNGPVNLLEDGKHLGSGLINSLSLDPNKRENALTGLFNLGD